jgi:hypothetical protein
VSWVGLSFLRGGGDFPAGAGIDVTASQCACLGGGVLVLRIERWK